MKAPIIVLEGLDACGKSTQTDLLLENLKKKNIKVGWKRFPGYEVTPAGARIAAYLRGEIGDFKMIDPRIIASLYAADRIAQVDEIEQLRNENDLVIFDRGVTSNIIYTGARASSHEERKELQEYIEELEYKVFGFPKESLVLFLDASFETRAKIHAAKGRTMDLHESDEEYLKKVQEVALIKCREDFIWQRIEVDKNGDIRRRDDIGKEIEELVLARLQKK